MSLSTLLTQWVSGMSWWAAGAGIVVDLVIIGVAAVLVPHTEKRNLRLALGLLGLHVALLLPLPLLSASAQNVLRLSALFMLLASLARASFLLLMDGVIERRLKRDVPQIFRDLLQVMLFVFAGLATLSSGGVDLSSLLATSAVITAVIGLSLQETLGNTIAGLAMQAQPPFVVGDWVELEGGKIGQVTSVGWRAITLLTTDDVEINLPNGILAKGAVMNYSRPTLVVRRAVKVSAPYSELPHHVESVLLDAIVGVPGVLAAPAPHVITGNFGESGIEYQLRFFITDFRNRDGIDSLVRDRIWYAFRRECITIPYPTHELFIHHAGEPKQRQEAEDRLQDRLVALGRVDFLAELPEDALRDLALAARRKPYASGELILEQGESGDEFFVIRKGKVAVLSGTREIATLEAGQFFGEMSLMTGAPRSATVRADGPCELVVIHKPSMKEVLETHPQVVDRMTAVLEARAHTLHDVEEAAAAEGVGGQRALVSRIRDFFKLA